MKTNHWTRPGNFVGKSMSGIPIGHISYNFGKKYMSFSQVLQFAKGCFHNKILSRATCELSLNLDAFGCFDTSIIMQETIGEYGLEGNT